MIYCYFCKKKLTKSFKKIDTAFIYECKNCCNAFITFNRKKNINLKRMYDFSLYKKNEVRFRKRFTKLTDRILKYKKSGKLLEVGAGFGLFSKILLEKSNLKLEIVEPELTPHYLKKKPYKIHSINYEKFLKTCKSKFDLIIFMDIIEHFKNPLKILKDTSQILKNDGFIVIQTPNYLSLMAKMCKNWSWWMIEDHKILFSVKSIKKNLRLSRYKIKQLITYEDYYDFKKNLDGNFTYIKNIIIRKTIKFIFFSIFFPFYFFFRFIIWGLGYGGLIFLIAKKYNYKDEK